MGKMENYEQRPPRPLILFSICIQQSMAFTPNQGKASTPFEIRFNPTFVHFLGLNVDEKPDGSCDAFVEYTQLFKPSQLPTS